MKDQAHQEFELPEHVEPGERGFVLNATGEVYINLTRRAARTLRRVTPNASIDLFADNVPNADVFDKVFQFPNSRQRPKIWAMRHSRLQSTIMLDTDIIMLADVSDVFDIPDRFDMAGVLANLRSRQMTPPDPEVPPCFQPINTGVLAFRGSEKIRQFSLAWQHEMDAHLDPYDQTSFRTLLHQSDLKFATPPTHFNCINTEALDYWNANMAAPHILHVPKLHRDLPGSPTKPFDSVESIGETRARHFKNLLASDWSLGSNEARVRTPANEQENRLAQLEAEHSTRGRSFIGNALKFFGVTRSKSHGRLAVVKGRNSSTNVRKTHSQMLQKIDTGRSARRSPGSNLRSWCGGRDARKFAVRIHPTGSSQTVL